MEFNIGSLEDTKQLAQKLSGLVKTSDVITLQGDLGTGKTTFARFFINSLLDEDQEVLSPTFNLVLPYDTKDFTLWHFDLYRLKDSSEIEELGIYDAFDAGVSLIEWPEIINGILPVNRLSIEIYCDGDDRKILIEGYGNWKNRLLGLSGG